MSGRVSAFQEPLLIAGALFLFGVLRKERFEDDTPLDSLMCHPIRNGQEGGNLTRGTILWAAGTGGRSEPGSWKEPGVQSHREQRMAQTEGMDLEE